MMQKLRNMIRRGLITLLTDDNEKYPKVQITSFGVAKDAERFTPYGLYNNPMRNSTVLLFSVQGQEDNIVAMAQDYINRVKGLKEGEVVLANTKRNIKIKLNDDGDIEIDANGGNLYLNGDTEPLVLGNSFQTLYNAHTHVGGTGIPAVLMGAAQKSTKNFTE